ncbi:MAG: hypothetical protein H6907_10130 [Hyphomicrobiales bacterium]|nr:hypothetical protein [Hyphomicrobiales bacterium]MCP5372076.1 hypothetical protein [Hyphomicrobiales bacterium]
MASPNAGSSPAAAPAAPWRWIAGSAAGAALGWAAASLVAARMGTWFHVGAWQGDPWQGAAYALLLLAALSLVRAPVRWPARLGFAAACAVGGLALAAATPLGAASGVALLVLSAAGAALVAALASRAGTGDGAAAWSVVDGVLVAAVMTAAVGVLWMIVSAPAYAESFAILAWAVVALFHLAVVGLAVIGARLGRAAPAARRRLRPLSALALLLASLVASAGGVFYMIWAEGDRASPLEPPRFWDTAFTAPRPAGAAPEMRAEAAREPSLTRADVVAMLQPVGEASLAQLGTRYLLTGERAAAEKFHRDLMAAAAAGEFLAAEGSVKFGQRDVMAAAMFYVELRQRLPDLFPPADQAVLQAWFTEIAHHIFTPGWVDYLYAVPFRVMPYGPYLNQEVGAGAVAVLTRVVDPADKALHDTMDAFLTTRAVGWRRNFRNQDDSFHYQNVWMASAFALAKYVDGLDPAKMPGLRPAVEWIKRQTPVAGPYLSYGLPGGHGSIDALALGAFLLRDGEARWLLERELTAMRDRGGKLSETLPTLWLWDDSVKPVPYRPGDVLIRAASGYTFRPGRLIPDKVVMRSGGQDVDGTDGTYALFGLRNSGWHRYPATGTVIRLDHGGRAYVAEDIISLKHHWVPKGRSSHRDKKVDRVRLNGLLVARGGLDGLVGAISGVYSRWRQDSPEYAQPTAWARAGAMTVARFAIADWAGVAHDRTAVAVDDGTMVVADLVSAPPGRDTAVLWHLRCLEQAEPGLFRDSCATGGVTAAVAAAKPARVDLAPIRNLRPPADAAFAPDQQVRVSVPGGGHASALALSPRALGGLAVETEAAGDGEAAALVRLRDDGGETRLVIGRGGRWQFGDLSGDAGVLRLRRAGGRLQADFLAARDLRLPLPAAPRQVLLNGAAAPAGTWSWSGGVLAVTLAEAADGTVTALP